MWTSRSSLATTPRPSGARRAGRVRPWARLISGPDLDRLDDGRLDAAAVEHGVFGRITPEQKEGLVEALHAQGRYVAMTGDGVNDVLSLKKADLGIAMQSGSQATRGVADIVLTNDSFAVLPHAITEGQRIIAGMQSVLKLFLTRTFFLALLIIAVVWLARSPSRRARARSCPS